MSQVERVASALGEPTRRNILLALYEDPEPRTVDQVAALAGVHRTVAFNHLERLAELGYLVSEKRRGVRGKPAKLYRPAHRRLELSHPQRRFGELAALLAASLGGLGEPGVEAARAAGLGFGRSLAGGLAELGADYLVEDSSIVARNCVFREACDCARAVVCGLHSGLLEGARGRVGLVGQVVPGGPVGETGCRFVIKENC
jgi:predicted ArsR family transcriptional regulator